MKKIIQASLTALAILGILSSSAVLAANSDRLQWGSNGHYYQRIEKPITWFGAKEECQALGGHLATPTSIGEDAFIIDKLVRNVYTWHKLALGGADENNEVWRWITGETWNYSNWGYGEPDSNWCIKRT